MVNVCNDLTNQKKKGEFIKELAEKQEKERISHAEKVSKNFYPLKKLEKNSLKFEWKEQEIAEPIEHDSKLKKISAPLDEVLNYFDWSPFFWSWELKGKYPAIFERADFGKEAKELYENAQKIARTNNS